MAILPRPRVRGYHGWQERNCCGPRLQRLPGVSKTLHTHEGSTTTADRRVHARERLRALVDLDVGSQSGGVILNLSEGGLALTFDAKLNHDNVVPMGFELPTVHQRIGARGRVVWLNESKKVTGIKFEELPDDTLQKIREWISMQQWAKQVRGYSAHDRRTPESTSVPDPATSQEVMSAASNWFASLANPASAKPQPSDTGVPHPLKTPIDIPRGIGENERAAQPVAEVSAIPSGKRANRRVQPRQSVNPHAAYVDLGPDNGGMVSNLSEGGLALTALAELVGDQLLFLRFELPNLQDWIEARGRIIWLSESKKEAGVKFEELPADTLTKIKSWLSTQPGTESRREAPTPEIDWLAALRGSGEPSAHPVPVPLAASQKRESVPERPRQGKASPRSEPSRNRLAAIGAVVALVSFGTGILIDRHFTQRPPKPAEGNVAGVAQQAANEKASSANTQAYNQADLGSVAGSSEGSRSSSTSKSRLQSEGAADRGTNPAPVGRQDENGRSAANLQNKQALEPTSASPAGKPATVETNKSMSATNLPATTLARPSAPTETASPAREAVPPQINDTAPRGGAVLASEATPVGNPTPLKNVPPSTDATANGASVIVTMPPFPSIRVPPQLKSDLSRPGTSLQMAQLVSRVEPVYPAEAIRQRIEGTVKLYAIIGRDGAVAVAATGPPLLRDAAANAVRQWRYKPTVLGGQAIEAEEEIVVVFRLSASPPK